MAANEQHAVEYARNLETRQAGPAADAVSRLLIQCHELEAAMLAEPGSRPRRRRYFDHLRELSAGHTGLARAELPGLGVPLFFRAGSSDVHNLVQVFGDEEYGFPLATQPTRILDLGAYVGYAAVYLATRFPRAEILCVEPSADSFRLLALNTAAYPQITCVNAAVWGSAARLAVAARYYGDWGTHLAEGRASEAGGIPAFSVDDLLARAGWDRVDLVKCDIEGAERAVFAEPNAAWLHTFDALAIETHDTIAPGASAAVAACFPQAAFSHRRHGEHDVYVRRAPVSPVRPGPAPLKLISTLPPLEPVRTENVGADAWSFFAFDGCSLQLHPNPPGAAPARVVFPRQLDRHSRFSAGLHHAGRPAATICFTMSVERMDGTVVASGEHALAAGARVAWQVPLPTLTGPHRIVLSTTMSPGATHNYNAWARWEAPTLS